ncbi:hypothetical protein Q6289_27740, partial [Klebsiella pneumoniae]|nr:hypothetical protein [Klebsiella pneumoniae]
QTYKINNRYETENKKSVALSDEKRTQHENTIMQVIKEQAYDKKDKKTEKNAPRNPLKTPQSNHHNTNSLPQ